MTADPNKPESKPAPQESSAAQPAQPSAAPAASAPETRSSASEAASATTGTTGPDPVAVSQQLAAEVVKLEAQVKELNDRLLRSHAEMDNMRKRAEREREETAKYAISKFARDIVGVSDNFQRAVMAVPAAAIAEDPALKTLVDGVTMTEGEFIRVLEQHGVKRIDPVGQPFSPHLHQAMMEREDPTVPSGTVVQVFQAGYLIDERVIRPAMVVVSKGGAKPQRPGNGEPPASGNDAGTIG